MPFAQHVLFPVDLSPAAGRMAPAVAALAKRLAAPVTLLHALSESEPGIASAALMEITSKHFGNGLAVSRLIEGGEAAAAIVKVAGQLDSPLIMMPTHGTSAFRSLTIGSVTESVLRHTEAPVWTSAHCEDGGPLPLDYRTVVCGIDLGPASAHVLRAAADFAAQFGATLHAVHAQPGHSATFASATSDMAHRYLLDEARRAWPPIAEAAGLPASTPLAMAEEADIAEGICGFAERHQADLLVIGRGVSQGLLGRLRTHAHNIIRRSNCPVLSV
ncbi:MAG: universal stress protein [Bryobacterales bacterium]|nr:universal stress protein [Bryobacterales bacterium]